MRMRFAVALILFAGIICLSAPPSVLADSTQIQYQVSNISGSEWSYTYTLNTATPFAANEGLTVFFTRGLFSNLQDPPPSATDWFAFSLQPGPTLLTDGLYTALALTGGASLSGPFTITFDYSGPGSPGSQAFSIDQFDSNGNLLSNVTRGFTTPLTQVVPEPATGVLLLGGAAVVGALKKRRCRQAGQH
jgi:hypothetical protein